MSTTENERFGMKWYEPAQTYTFFDGENFLDKEAMVLVDPNSYPYEDGFFTLN